MIGIIVTSHEQLASGIITSLELVTGKQDNIKSVNFLKSMGTEDLYKKLKNSIDSMENEILILCDLAGGTPFNVSVKLANEYKNKKQIEVLAGVNLPMLIESVLSRESNNLNELVNLSLNSAKDAVKQFKLENKKFKENLEEGI